MVFAPTKLKVEQQASLVLHRKPYRETSLLLELLTQSHGRIALVAKGARKAKGRTGLLQPFQLLSCSWVSTTDLGTLTQVELATTTREDYPEPSFWQPKLHGSALYCGLYLNELIIRCTQRNHEVDGLMARYSLAIENLARGNNEASVLRQFEWQLINILGLGASLEVDNNNQPIEAETYYCYQHEAGLVMVSSKVAGAILGKSLLELAANNWHNELLQNAARKLTTQALKPLVGNKPFSTRSLYLGLKKQQSKAASK